MNYRIIFNRTKSDIEKTADVPDDETVFRRFGDAKKALKDLMRADMRVYKEAIGRIHDLNESDIPEPKEG